MSTSMLHKSTISGSRAALSITVTPFARTAAVRMFSVAPTLGNFSSIVAPCKSFAVARMPSLFSSNVAPIASKPKTCKSIGRDPKSSPPGIAMSALPYRPTRGPSTLIDARIRSTCSNGATGVMFPVLLSTNSCVPILSDCTPSARNRSHIVSTSAMSGTLVRRYSPSASRVTAISLRTEFLAPGT